MCVCVCIIMCLCVVGGGKSGLCALAWSIWKTNDLRERKVDTGGNVPGMGA